MCDGAVGKMQLVGDLLLGITVDIFEIEDIPLPVGKIEAVTDPQDILITRQPFQFRRCHPIPLMGKSVPRFNRRDNDRRERNLR